MQSGTSTLNSSAMEPLDYPLDQGQRTLDVVEESSMVVGLSSGADDGKA